MKDDKTMFSLTIVAIVAIVGMVGIVGFLEQEQKTALQSVTGLATSKIQASVSSAASGAKVSIPLHAVEVAPNIFDLGTAADRDGRIVQGYMFVDNKNENARPPWTGSGGSGASKCFSFLAKGAKWKTIEPWIANTANSEGLLDDFVFNNLNSDIGKWESAALVNILGDGSMTTGTLVADTLSPDNVNEVYFGDVDSGGAIAVTIVWGIFSGPPGQRELVEWDQIYDQVDFDWSSIGEAGKMDFENIATHELGHSVGMGHPDDGCTEETMYRFASAGETKKRDLNAGDISGVAELYR